MLRKVVFILVFLALSVSAIASDLNVGINKIRAQNNTYMLNLLKLALSYSDKPYQFKQTNERLSKDAQYQAALHGTIAIFWGGTSPEQEETFIPVRIDGYRGLMSLRFMIVREEDVSRFSQVTELSQLRQISMGQGRGWKDGDILRSAGFKVELSSKKKGLFHMLEGGRFDAFPRGATEAWTEAEANKDLQLAVEKHLIIRYPLPTYFFVNKNRNQLAQDIERGLKSALKDGEFDRFFYSSDRVQRFLQQANLQQRKIIDLDNPFLTPEAIDSRKYNLSVEDLILGWQRIQQGEFALNANGS